MHVSRPIVLEDSGGYYTTTPPAQVFHPTADPVLAHAAQQEVP